MKQPSCSTTSARSATVGWCKLALMMTTLQNAYSTSRSLHRLLVICSSEDDSGDAFSHYDGSGMTKLVMSSISATGG